MQEPEGTSFESLWHSTGPLRSPRRITPLPLLTFRFSFISWSVFDMGFVIVEPQLL